MDNIQEDALLRSFPNNILSSLLKKYVYRVSQEERAILREGVP